jgi:hypothetical protein
VIHLTQSVLLFKLTAKTNTNVDKSLKIDQSHDTAKTVSFRQLKGDTL